ncbi:MAG: hypothetical protein JW932_02405 [Deltaproteobacteria bacterium]|nr:hypothetical protein [Deltaproteobacteria bacterium]
MDDEEFQRKYINLRILKSVQEYLKSEKTTSKAVYPINVPDDLLYQITKIHGPEGVDKLIHHIFILGLNIWSDRLFEDVFGTQKSLEEFIQLVKEQNKSS